MHIRYRERASRSRDRLAEVTGFFLRALAAPSQARPTVRCLSRRNAERLVLEARDAVGDSELRRESASTLLSLLEKSRVLQAVPIVAAPKRREGLYVVGAQPLETLEPVELLQAAEPAGLVCYFTALAYHGLTTQIPTQHHIAQLVVRPRTAARALSPVDATSTTPRLRRDPLGTALFSYQGVPYYATSRAAHTVAGVQLRQVNELSRVRITTREQALLDTLHRPLSCGGLSVVWEAWQTGLTGLDEARLLEHLVTLGDPKMPRRVGYLLAVMGYVPGEELQRLLDASRAALREGDPIVPLFPGLPSIGMDATWRLEVPSP